jgi:hypothetical protein
LTHSKATSIPPMPSVDYINYKSLIMKDLRINTISQ